MYMLMPLHTHIDFGFGATGEAFKDAADQLEESLKGEGVGIFNEYLPINYLRRHAIELFLKSGIVIIHRRFAIPYGSDPTEQEPGAFVNGKWQPFIRLHSVSSLWSYLKTLFVDQKAALDAIEHIEWLVPAEVDSWIDTIERLDPRSTFFRYPNPEKAKDELKSAMARTSAEELLKKHKENPEKKQRIVVLEDMDRQVTDIYYYDGRSLDELTKVLKECSQHFFSMHAALRMGICKGG